MTKQRFYTDPPKDGKAKIFDVRSKKDPDKYYKMRVMPDGEVRCGCPWNAIRSGLCSHIREYLDLEAVDSKPKNLYQEGAKRVMEIRAEKAVSKRKFGAEFPF